MTAIQFAEKGRAEISAAPIPRVVSRRDTAKQLGVSAQRVDQIKRAGGLVGVILSGSSRAMDFTEARIRALLKGRPGNPCDSRPLNVRHPRLTSKTDRSLLTWVPRVHDAQHSALHQGILGSFGSGCNTLAPSMVPATSKSVPTSRHVNPSTPSRSSLQTRHAGDDVSDVPIWVWGLVKSASGRRLFF